MAPPPPEPVVAVAAVAAPTTTSMALEQSTPAPGPALESQRSAPTPFLSKTYQLVDDPAVNDVISWNGEGSAFVVWRPAEFARDLLPKYFKHSNFSSFVRQLNTYGFRKIATDRWEFFNESFRRGEKRLLCDIQRRKIPMSMVAATPPPLVVLPSPANSGEEQVMSSSSSAMAGTDLSSENERLRRENEQLSRELSEMKSLCNNILGLMSNYAAKTSVAVTGSDALALELMPAVVAEQSPRLFGVSIGEKRTRSDEVEDPKKEVKRDLSDSDPDPIDRQDPRNWMLCCPPPANQ